MNDIEYAKRLKNNVRRLSIEINDENFDKSKIGKLINSLDNKNNKTENEELLEINNSVKQELINVKKDLDNNMNIEDLSLKIFEFFKTIPSLEKDDLLEPHFYNEEQENVGQVGTHLNDDKKVENNTPQHENKSNKQKEKNPITISSNGELNDEKRELAKAFYGLCKTVENPENSKVKITNGKHLNNIINRTKENNKYKVLLDEIAKSDTKFVDDFKNAVSNIADNYTKENFKQDVLNLSQALYNPFINERTEEKQVIPNNNSTEKIPIEKNLDDDLKKCLEILHDDKRYTSVKPHKVNNILRYVHISAETKNKLNEANDGIGDKIYDTFYQYKSKVKESYDENLSITGDFKNDLITTFNEICNILNGETPNVDNLINVNAEKEETPTVEKVNTNLNGEKPNVENLIDVNADKEETPTVEKVAPIVEKVNTNLNGEKPNVENLINVNEDKEKTISANNLLTDLENILEKPTDDRELASNYLKEQTEQYPKNTPEISNQEQIPFPIQYAKIYEDYQNGDLIVDKKLLDVFINCGVNEITQDTLKEMQNIIEINDTIKVCKNDINDIKNITSNDKENSDINTEFLKAINEVVMPHLEKTVEIAEKGAEKCESTINDVIDKSKGNHYKCVNELNNISPQLKGISKVICSRLAKDIDNINKAINKKEISNVKQKIFVRNFKNIMNAIMNVDHRDRRQPEPSEQCLKKLNFIKRVSTEVGITIASNQLTTTEDISKGIEKFHENKENNVEEVEKVKSENKEEDKKEKFSIFVKLKQVFSKKDKDVELPEKQQEKDKPENKLDETATKLASTIFNHFKGTTKNGKKDGEPISLNIEELKNNICYGEIDTIKDMIVQVTNDDKYFLIEQLNQIKELYPTNIAIENDDGVTLFEREQGDNKDLTIITAYDNENNQIEKPKQMNSTENIFKDVEQATKTKVIDIVCNNETKVYNQQEFKEMQEKQKIQKQEKSQNQTTPPNEDKDKNKKNKKTKNSYRNELS